MILTRSENFGNIDELAANTVLPFMNIDMPPVMSVTTALILAFVLGLGLTAVNGNYFKNTFHIVDKGVKK